MASMHGHGSEQVSEVRKFGSGLGVVLSVLGAVQLWQGDLLPGILLLVCALLVLISFWFLLPGTLRFYRGWMSAAKMINRYLFGLLLVLLYMLVITPIGLFVRFFGTSPMDRRFPSGNESEWIVRSSSRVQPSPEKQY